MLPLTFPPGEQWRCNFNLLRFVGSSQDNSLKFGVWEFLQPALQGGGRSTTAVPWDMQPPLGTQMHRFSPGSKARNGKWGNRGAPGAPKTHRQAKPPAFKDASFANSQLPIQQRKREPWDQHTQQFACIFIPGLCRQQEKLTEGSSSRASIWREMQREFRRLCRGFRVQQVPPEGLAGWKCTAS